MEDRREGETVQYSDEEVRFCLAEKHRIIMSNKAETINKRADLVTKCRHANKFCPADFADVT